MYLSLFLFFCLLFFGHIKKRALSSYRYQEDLLKMLYLIRRRKKDISL